MLIHKDKNAEKGFHHFASIQKHYEFEIKHSKCDQIADLQP